MSSSDEGVIDPFPTKIKKEKDLRKKIYPQKFRKAWLDNPNFSSWLEEVEDDPSKSYCSACNVDLAAKIFDIRKHSETKKHSYKLKLPRSTRQPRPSKIKTSPDEASTPVPMTLPPPSLMSPPTSQVESIVVNFPEVNRTTPVNHLLQSRISNDTLRLWQCCGTEILPHNLMYPIFVTDSPDAVQPISSLPGIFRYGVNKVCDFLQPLVYDGLSSILLHGIPTKMAKDNAGTAANATNNPLILAIKKIKEIFPALTVACDLCLCPFTSHGHCGVLTPDGIIDNDATVRRLSDLSLTYAFAGANIIAPSDMMDGRVAAIKLALQQSGLANRVSVVSYSAKFASSLYGDLKEPPNQAMVEVSDGFAGFGDRRCYQLPPGSMGMALKSVERDIAEGADMLIVKPALPYLDVVQQIKEKYPTHPIFAYQVSGEYRMLHHASSADAFDLQSTLQEILISIRRAGADVIITYFTPMILQWLKH